jgi:hypothetical protein
VEEPTRGIHFDQVKENAAGHHGRGQIAARRMKAGRLFLSHGLNDTLWTDRCLIMQEIIMQHNKRAHHFALIALAGAIIIVLSGCNISVNVREDGDIYGYYRSTSNCTAQYLSLGGFPEGILLEDTNYQIKAGTYSCRYVLYDGFRYWPGNAYGTGGFDSSYYWKSTYTVNANSGTAAGKGETKHFGLYLSKAYGLTRDSGDVSVKSTPYYSVKSADGFTPQVYVDDGVTITNEIGQR